LVLGVIATVAPANAQTGPNNAITDVPGILVGHSTRLDALTGTTALIFPDGALMGVSPSGGAPGTRLSTLLTAQHQDSLRVVMHGLVLSGGSIYGLDTACGVVKYLDEQGVGFGGRAHVPGAIIFDLNRGDVDAPPGTGADPCADGYIAASTAAVGAIEQGSVGGGTGARVGGLKSGVGTASLVMDDGTIIGALVIVNSAGSVYNEDSKCELYTLWLELDNEFGKVRVPPNGCGNDQPREITQRPGENTTIGVIATSAPLTAGQTERLAIVTNDGMARAIRPAHSTGDGDTVFAVTLAEDPSTVHQENFVERQQFSRILSAAADVYSRAITHAVLSANPDLGETYCERFPNACPPALISAV
jgi:L-aminopeptidase/D-esterase-like protein